MLNSSILLALSTVLSIGSAWDNSSCDGLIVKTPSGRYAGLIDGRYPNVRQWRSVPFASPPVGQLRWSPPMPNPSSNETRPYDATQYPPSCPQYLSSTTNLWNTIVTQFIIATTGQPKNAGQYAYSSAEDCLYLGVWAPVHVEKPLPVVMFMTGGAFVSGGVDIPYQIPAPWVERSQSHIVVTIK